jgi:hypothetical protein
MKVNFSYPHNISEFNSNNAWGFGGAFGKSYDFENGLEVRVGTACYRHTGTRKYVAVWHEGAKILELTGHTKKNHDKVLKLIDEIMSKSNQPG